LLLVFIYRTNFSCLSRFALYIVHTVAFASCLSLKKVDDDDRELRCSVTHAKRSFHRSINAIFGKAGRLASEEVTLQLAKSKCIPILMD